jgi:hypothetical protein
MKCSRRRFLYDYKMTCIQFIQNDRIILVLSMMTRVRVVRLNMRYSRNTGSPLFHFLVNRTALVQTAFHHLRAKQSIRNCLIDQGDVLSYLGADISSGSKSKTDQRAICLLRQSGSTTRTMSMYHMTTEEDQN